MSGDVQLVSMQGFGTDAYIRLKPIADQTEHDFDSIAVRGSMREPHLQMFRCYCLLTNRLDLPSFCCDLPAGTFRITRLGLHIAVHCVTRCDVRLDAVLETLCCGREKRCISILRRKK